MGSEEEKLQSIPKANNVLQDMHAIVEGLKISSKITTICNAAVHSIRDDAPCLAPNSLPVSC